MSSLQVTLTAALSLATDMAVSLHCMATAQVCISDAVFVSGLGCAITKDLPELSLGH